MRSSGPQINRAKFLAERGQHAFTLMEVVFAMALVGILILALYGAIASSVSLVRICQENQRVTQILSDKLDTLRLYNWAQINSNGFVATNFVLGIDPMNDASTPYYTGRITMVKAPVMEDYRSNLIQVDVSIDWVSGSRPQSRAMSTYVAKHGLQSYIIRTAR